MFGGNKMKFNLTGYNLDNLLKTLYNKKIALYNVNRIAHNKVCFEVRDNQAPKVKRYVANFKVKQTLSAFKRLPKILVANIGVILGVFFGSIFYLFSSNYIWQIRVYGTKDLSEQEIIQVLETNGVKKGKLNLKSSQEIESILLNNYDKIAQVSVIKKGTAILINLSEKLVYIETEYKPITAKYSGIIKEINIITGTLNVKVGDYVNVGDVLVLPFNLDANNNKISVEPLAEIKADIFVVAKCQLEQLEQVLVRTGNTSIEYKYKLFNFNIFSGRNKNSFALFESNVYNESVGELLPFTRDVITYYELAYSTVEHNLEEEKQDLIEKSQQQAYQNLPAGKILKEETKTSLQKNILYAVTTLTIYGNIND